MRNGGWHQVDGREYNRKNDDEDWEFKNMKFTHQFFKGSSYSNVYLDWIVKIEGNIISTMWVMLKN